ncbi:hypothetical protein K505DRAFT_359432 [Melanomma pulvis-pyrius CBS 109.77]|uniref:Uncharacterized protein n=1 Tax=Melanomma pulvis-pyrius CBS 109.77 TaxID=1314802 RepID=A0A6A6XIJ3_9PLEO|nr:hypothetical protein K505DRAFT_359432 [Melanomma pulvis-pyrius CBS 109.77]
MAPYMGYTEPISPRPRPLQPAPEHSAIEYRQLVSRAVTRRLLDPLLDAWSPTEDDMDGFAKWEFDDRKRARERAREALRRLGTAWDGFCLDVEQAQQETHVLGPTRYEGPSKFATRMETEDVGVDGVEEGGRFEVADRVQCRGGGTGTGMGMGTGMMVRFPDMDPNEVKRRMEAQIGKLREFAMQRRAG